MQKSEVEKFYEAVQAKLGGNVPWYELHPYHQNEFTEACNTIAMIAEAVKKPN